MTKAELNELMEAAWHKIHSLQCDLEYLNQERDSKPEQVKAKHAWDMILAHSSRELRDVKRLLEMRHRKE